MLDDYGFEVYEENAFPIAYLITFRTFGTWLHGDERGSYEREKNRFGSKYVAPNVPLKEAMASTQKQAAVILGRRERLLVHHAIEEVAVFREYNIRALNVRTNHAHTVVSKAVRPEKIVNDFKAYATRRLRQEYCFSATAKIWTRGASTRYLWKPLHVAAAVDYVLYSQGDVPFEMVTEAPRGEIE